MASSSLDPDSVALLGLISRLEPINIYRLSREAKWSYGKTERKVAELVKEGQVHARTRVADGRNIKLLSLHPMPDLESTTSKSGAGVIPEAIKDAFEHLYGIFRELNAVGLDPTPALLSYGKKKGMTSDALIDMLDKAWELVEGQ